MSLTDKPVVKYRKDYRPSQYLIKKTQLNFELFDEHVIVSSTLKIERNPLDQHPSLLPLVLDGIELELLDISVDGENLTQKDFVLDKEFLTLHKVSKQFSLTTKVKIYPNKNTSLQGLYLSNGKFCTQCEAEGFRKITYYLDRPDVMSEFLVYVEGDKRDYPLLLSNGNPIGSGELENNRHYTNWHDPFPKPSYLFALVAGDLDRLEDQFTTMSGRQVKLELLVDKGKLDQCRFAMDSLIKSMHWDEQEFGREYDLDLYMIVAVGDFNMGAMENKGLNVFNTAYVLANKQTATDSDFEGVERVIAHEYFHNWTGNRITCRDWFQLSLKEGLTVFRDQKFSEDMQSAAVERIEQVKIIRAAQFVEDSSPMAHSIRPDSYIEMNNFYTVTVYNKGAEVIRMMHTLLDKQGFRAGMDLYFDRHDGQAVTCEDFIKAMEDANQVNWSLFRNWYRQAGTPTLNVHMEKTSTNRLQLNFSQHCPDTPDQTDKKPYLIPVKLGFVNKQGNIVKFKIDNNNLSTNEMVQQVLIEISQKNQSIKIDIENSNCIPSLLRSFSAPVKLKYHYSQDDLACLFAHDSDSFNRWDAGQCLMSRLLLSEHKIISNENLVVISSAIKNILADKTLDGSLKSLAVQTPNLNSLIDEVGSVALDDLFAKHRQLIFHIANALEKQWLEIYNQINSASEDKITSSDRRLKNTALGYLVWCNEEKYIIKAVQQQLKANNMTDEMAALQIICHSTSNHKKTQIQHFYHKWANEDLVLDKWFSAQVMQDHESVFADIEALLSHDKFSITNPNKVRSVIAAFVANNTQQFHNATGAGYKLLTRLIIRLNPINPQIAARLAKQFWQWKKLDVKRQALIKEHLEQILTIDDLSNDIYEIVEKLLE